MSSLVLVSRVEETSAMPPAPGPRRRPPLYVGRTAALSESRRADPSESAASELPFYFTLYGNVRMRDASRASAAQRPAAGRGAGRASAATRPTRPARRPASDRRPSGGHLRAADSRARAAARVSRTAFFTLVE